MDELEQKLQSMRLAPPSSDLDRRMESAFNIARPDAAQGRSTRFWWWLMPAAAACSMAALTLVLLPKRQPEMAPAVHRIEAQGLMREMLLNSAADRDVALPRFVADIATP